MSAGSSGDDDAEVPVPAIDAHMPVGIKMHFHLLGGVTSALGDAACSIGEHYVAATEVVPESEVVERLRFRTGGVTYYFHDALPGDALRGDLDAHVTLQARGGAGRRPEEEVRVAE